VTISYPRRFRQPTSRPSRQGDPIAEFEQLQEQMGQILNSFLRDPAGGSTGQQAPAWIPAADIEETDDAYVLELEVPGVKKDDVHIELRNNEVRITGEIRQKERKGVVRRQTRRVGEFEYMITLPDDVNAEKVEAALHDGVLTVRLAKAAASQPHQIEVKEG
jgi:HSP20 family protein